MMPASSLAGIAVLPSAMRKRFFLIDNPASGRGRRHLGAQVAADLERAGAAVVRCAADASRACELATSAARDGEHDAVIAAGGDGTIRVAAAAVADTQTPLGVIPLGTANVLAHEINLPRSPAALAQLLLSGPVVSIRVPVANGVPFLLMAGAGFDGRVIETLSDVLKGRIGKLAYAGPLLRALGRQPDALDVRIDGKVHSASWAVIANARHYAGAFVISGTTSLHRSGLEAVLFKTSDRAKLVSSLLALASGRLAHCRHVERLACRRVEIRANPAVPVQVDGDAFGCTPLVVDSGGPLVALIVPPGAETKPR
jgi:diacylglycerol kinase family enzyme